MDLAFELLMSSSRLPVINWGPSSELMSQPSPSRPLVALPPHIHLGEAVFSEGQVIGRPGKRVDSGRVTQFPIHGRHSSIRCCSTGAVHCNDLTQDWFQSIMSMNDTVQLSLKIKGIVVSSESDSCRISFYHARRHWLFPSILVRNSQELTRPYRQGGRGRPMDLTWILCFHGPRPK